MSTSTLKFYKNTPILPNKNFMVDEIDDYLYNYYEQLVATKHEFFSITDFQYIKHSLNLEIKIDSEQSNLEFLLDNGWNYMSIQNSDSTRVVYYFIVGKEWRAQGTIKMSLYLDTINTFKYQVDYILSDKTKVMREHKDRFERFVLKNNFPLSSRLEINSSFNYAQLDKQETRNGTYFKLEIPASNFPGFSVITSYDAGRYIVNIFPSQSIYDSTHSLSLIGYSIYYTGVTLELFSTIRNAAWSVVAFGLDVYFIQETPQPVFMRKIDYFNEGLNPILYKKDENLLLQNNDLNLSWNITFKGSDKVSCYLVPEEPVKTLVATGGDNLIVNYSAISEGSYYLFMYGYNDEPMEGLVIYDSPVMIGINSNNNQFRLTRNETFAWSQQLFGYAFKHPTGQNYLEMYSVSWEKNRFSNEWKCTYQLIASSLSNFQLLQPLSRTYLYSGSGSFPSTYATENFSLYFTPSGTDMKTLYSIDQIDRTDSTLIKIIKSPYLPNDFEYNDLSGLQLKGNNWSYDGTYNEYLLRDNSAPLSTLVVTNTSGIYGDLMLLEDYFKHYESYDAVGIGYSDERRMKNESKLYHSSFYQKKFVYDSFSFTYQYEKMDIEKSYLAYADINFAYANPSSFPIIFNFAITKTINSKFLFSFPDYKLKMSEEDYDNVLPVARNNEEVIYNSAYITYLRTGYNYDLKAKERTEKLAGLQFGLQTGVGAIQSIATTAFHPVAGALSMGGVFASTITGITQLINTIAQAEDSINRKISSAKAQAVSVAGSDDVDLLVQYSSNRAKLCTYQASDRVREMLWDLFHYTGYATGEMKVPNLNTRIHFNFIQAEIVVKENKANIPQSLLDNISERFISGITNLHRQELIGPPWWVYDFEQQYENWETSLMKEIYQ